MNPFQNTFENRLREWKELRKNIQGQSLETTCIKVDEWWQRAPLVNHHLHPKDTENWPDPWTMLSENEYCTLTRAIGICYTLLMSDIKELQLVEAVDPQGDEHNLVVVNHAKYVLNYYPNCVLSTTLNEFKVKDELSIETLKKHIK